MSSDTNTKEVIDKEEKKSKKKEEEVEVKVAEDVEELKEERFYEHDLFPTERWHRNPIHHDDPDSRLERLSDSYSDWKSCVTPVPKGMTFELFADKDRRFTQVWRVLPVYELWVDTIKQMVWQQHKLKITSCMCLGLGPFSGPNA